MLAAAPVLTLSIGALDAQQRTIVRPRFGTNAYVVDYARECPHVI